MLKFKDNATRLSKELAALEKLNSPLFHLLQDASKFIEDTYKKDLILTMLSRTQAEQDSIYKNDPKYKIKPFTSPHQLNHAADVRSLIFTPEEIKGIEDYLNNKYNKTNYYNWTAKNHVVSGGALHFHIQFVARTPSHQTV
jgi:hypothetical protein